MIITLKGVEIDLSKQGKQQCPRCASNGNDRSRNNLHVYGLDGQGQHLGCRCFACDFSIPSEAWSRDNFEYEYKEEDFLGAEFNEEVHSKLKEGTGLDPRGYRGISQEISKWFGVRYRYNETDGTVVETYYPTTKESKIAGYKVRRHPKNFHSPGPTGETGKDCDLFGQFRFESYAGTIVIVGGEHDQLAAFQMLKSAQKNKDWDAPAVVSATIGESGAYKQIQAQYAFFNRFKKIILCFDSDEAGQEAASLAAKVLPRGRVYNMKMRYKDPNEYLLTGKDSEFVSDFWNAKLHTPAGVHASSDLYERAVSYAEQAKLTLPSIMPKAAKMFGGGLVKGEINLIFAKTSIGKTTIVNRFTTEWVMNDPDEVVGVLSLEATVDKYGTSILSDYLGVKLIRLSPEERKEYLSNPVVREKADELLVRPDGSPKFYVCDDRGAEIEIVKEKILEMIIQMGVTILIVDPFSDLQDGMDNSQQAEFSSWMKKVLKEYPHVSLVLVAHVRKGKNGEDGKPLTEDDVIGSSTLVKSAAQSISLERDKLHENPIMRNVTRITIHKNRHFSETGPADDLYYDWKTGQLHNFEEYMRENPELFSF